MSIGTGIKSTLSLGKGLGKTIDDTYKKYIKGGGKKTKKAFTAEELSKKKQLDKAKQNRQKRKQMSKKEYEKTLPNALKKKGTALVSLNKNIKNIAEKSLKDKKKGTSIIKKPSSNVTKKPGTSLVVSNQSRNLVNIPKGSAGKQTSKNILNKQKQSFLKRNKGKIAAGTALLSTVPFLINTDDSKIGAKENKKVKPPKDFSPKIKKTPTPSVKREDLPKTKSNDYTGRFIDKEGNVAYDSFSDFIAHMTGKPKKRAMPKKTARIIGTGNKLKRKEADTKGAGKGVKFKAFKAGTKDKTISQKQLDKNAKYKASKAYQLKNMEKVGLMDIIKNPIKAIKKSSSDVTTARRRAKQVAAGDPIAERKYGTGKRTGDKMSYMYPEGVLKFKPDGSVEKPLKSYKRNPKSKNRSGFEVTNKSGGGLIAGLYDKPEKAETYKGNTSSARQVKGYGKARKRP